MGKERNEMIARMWDTTGLSATEIGKAIGVTRGVVMGVIHRFKLNGRVFHRKKKEPVTVAHPKKEEPPVVEETIEVKKPELVPKLKPEPVPKPVQETLKLGLQIWDLKRTSCRYILGPVNGAHTLYCGEPVVGRSFCEQHQRLCYIYAKPSTAQSADTVGDAEG
jgi:hypothetical protein